jgi:lactate permease
MIAMGYSSFSAIAMLTALHLSTAEKSGAVGRMVTAASGIDGGLASVIYPAKLKNASAAIDCIGEESKVLLITLIKSLAITFFVAY